MEKSPNSYLTYKFSEIISNHPNPREKKEKREKIGYRADEVVKNLGIAAEEGLVGDGVGFDGFDLGIDLVAEPGV